MVPQFFRGASKLYASPVINGHMRKTVKKHQPSNRTLQIMHNSSVYQMEREFYDFAVIVFEDIKHRTIYFRDGSWKPIGKKYHYEKIKP
jgi:heparan sulfate 2-O-sulfotransferase HS2ST1